MMNTIILQKKIEELTEVLESIPTDLILIVIDSNVWQLFRSSLNFQLKNKKVMLFTAIPGEDSKSFKEFEKCVEYFLSRGIHRQAHLVAIGGGAVTDMAGFVASSLLRGLPWHVVPTTLLSMIDAAIGGKVAINSQSGKNLVGAFHAPTQVIICHEFLATLPKEEYWSGVGELLKYAMLDQEIYQHIVQQNKIDMTTIMACANYKYKVTSKDFKENGLRKILNFGHTLGHALEWHYRLSHGEAVFWGMLTKLKLLGCEEAIESFKRAAIKLQWPKRESPWYQKKMPIEALIELMQKDKKIQNENIIQIAKINSPGHVIIEEMNFEKFADLLRNHEEQIKTLSI